MSAQGLGGLLRLVVVAEHYCGAGEHDLAFLSIRQFLISVRLDNLEIRVGEWNADAALFLQCDRGKTAGCDALGGAVTLAHLDGRLMVGEELVHLLLELNGQGVSA